LSHRRHLTARPARSAASDTSKSIELESRIGRLEVLVKGLQEELAIRQRHEVTMQAELDHLWARLKLLDGI
jgi:uncharacterized coiled-coil protein SlyX